jgi:hypothetical protein
VIIMAIELRLQAQKTRKVALLGIDCALRLAGYVGTKIPLG